MGELITPPPPGNSFCFKTLSSARDTSHLMGGKATSPWPQDLPRAAATSSPDSTTLTALVSLPTSLLCQSSHSAALSPSNIISPVRSARKVGHRAEDLGSNHSGNSTTPAAFSYHCLSLWGPRRGAQSSLSYPGGVPALWCPVLALARHRKARAGCWTAPGAESAST